MMIGVDAASLTALAAVVVIDVVLSGDNAIIIGLAVAGLPREKRARIIMLGIAAATVLRIGFALVAVPLLRVIGLTLAGGLLLLWVVWKMWRELWAEHVAAKSGAANCGSASPPPPQLPTKTAGQAVLQIVLADVSMSLDNVLAVAGAAREHPWVLVVGLGLSVALMAVASTLVARLLSRYRWLAFVGLAVIAVVAVSMIWQGGVRVWHVAA